MFFNKTNRSQIMDAGGPPPEEQLKSMIEGKFWRVLNQKKLQDIEGYHTEPKFCKKVNALKHGLQVWGPRDSRLPHFKANACNKNLVFHGHINNSNGTTFVLEWAIVDESKKILALTRFAPHENFDFKPKQLSKVEKDRILKDPENIALMERIETKTVEAKKKGERLKISRLLL